MPKPSRLLLLPLLASSMVGCTQPSRYAFISENVAVAAAGAAGANEFSTPETTTEDIRGRIYRLDTKTGEIVVVWNSMNANAEGEVGYLSVRVFSPRESNEILSLQKSNAD